MKFLISFIIFSSSCAMASNPSLVEQANQEKLVLQDLEQIQNHGKKWHSRLKKATTAVKPMAVGPIQHEG
ncbi:MAG TPA: hypothetical protein VKZ84_08290 [Bacteriovoracaceae bacterium]|nr:hypothetical protein [Bacteriovoracaceae bacterium]